MNWLLLRGLAREARHWGSFADHMARRLGARVETLDLPGAGSEHRRRAPLSIPAYVEDLRQRWLELRDGAEGPWGVLSVSLGGMISLAWVTAHPRDFTHQVVVNSSARNLAPAWRRFNLRFLPGIAKAMVWSDDVGKERFALGMTTNHVDDLEAMARDFATFRHDAPIARATFFRQMLAASRYRAPDRVDVPTLVLWSKGDRLVDPICSERLADRLGAARGVHPTAGHDLSTDAPDWLCDQVRDFVG